MIARGVVLAALLFGAVGHAQPTSSSSSAAPSSSSSSSSSASKVPANVDAQALAFINARLALRDGRPQDVLRLWLLRNALASAGHAPVHDGDFRSIVWAALGEQGYCADGFIEDSVVDNGFAGAGLWPLSVHNWLLKNVAKPPPSQPEPWSSLRGGVVQRQVSLHDVLSGEELQSVRFFRASCFMPFTQQLRVADATGSLSWVDMEDRLSVGFMMRDLLVIAETRLAFDKVEGRALLATRRFDLEAALTKMQATRARQQQSLVDQMLRAAGVSPGGRFAVQQQSEAQLAASTKTALWNKARTWPTSEWLSLSSARRLSLWAEIDKAEKDEALRARVITSMIDGLLARRGPGDGRELQSWLGFAGRYKTLPKDADVDARFGDPDRTALLASITDGERGEALLALDPQTGFRERAAIALHRGVKFLADGDVLAALRSFATALSTSADGSNAEVVHGLSRRWLAFVLSQYTTTDEVLGVIDRFVPTIDYAAVVETLVWRAAFHGDTDAAARIAAQAKAKKSAAVLKLSTQLQPLTNGDPAALMTSVNDGRSDAAVARFAEQLLDHLALEPIDVRHNQRRTLELLLEVLEPQVERASPSQRKRLEKVTARAQALRDTVGAYDDSLAGRLDQADPDTAAYAGSVRLAPADPLPWPFAPAVPTPPNPFAPIKLVPVEWKQPDGSLLYAWSLRE